MRPIEFALGMLLLAQLAGPLEAAPRLWAVSENVRVNPVTGELFEARPDIHRDYPRGDYSEGNLAWDAGRRTVKLRAARNEFTAFQLIIQTDEPLEEVDVALPALVHASGARIEGRNLALFQEWYVHVRRPSTGYEATSLGAGWYPDALMPKRRAGLHPGFPFSIPDRYNNIPDQQNQAVWVDVYVPAEAEAAPAGVYEGEAEVTWKGGSDRVRVELEVWDFALPQDNHSPGDIWNDSMRDMTPREELAYYQMAKRHRFLPLVYGYRPQLSVEGGQVELDWSDYDRRLGKYLDGSAFTDEHGYWGPGYGVPVRHMMLPFNIRNKQRNKGVAWPIDVPDAGRTPEYEHIWKETGRQVREHLDSHPAWRKVKKIAFLNGLDESYYEDAYAEMLDYGRILHEAMGRGWFQYRVDGGYDKDAMGKLSKEVDLWVCHTAEFDKELADFFRPKGVETWFYGPMVYEQKRNSGCGSNTFLDLDLLVNRAIGWISWKYQTGWVEWEFDFNAYASWYEAENFKDEHRFYNGSGQLIYRGDVMGYGEPIPSIRLKATRRGLQDYEYFWLLSQRPGGQEKADAIVDGIVVKQPFGLRALHDTEIWRNNPDQWEEQRLLAGEALARRSR
ncbi:MAG: DUF4091 domain-containing protein [Acidobacteria bacterium]|nr:DUF4091 domain-containing protein [Acidobacteriota bacterium]